MNNKAVSDLFKNDYNLDSLGIVTPKGDNFSMYVTPRFRSSYVQEYEKFSTRIVKNIVKKCDLFVDVGANYGYYSLLAADANKTVKIIAVEPIVENFEVLKKNLVHNNIGPQRAKCIKAAVSSVSGRTKFYKSEASDKSSVLPHPHSETLEYMEVDAVRLDDILEQEEYKSLFIKTDTDGNELEVLKGLSATYDKCDDVTILLELNPKMLKLAGSSCDEVIEYLAARDFNLYAIDDKEFRYYPLHVKGNLEMMCSVFETSYFNVLCVKGKNALSVVFFSHSAGLFGAERSLLDLIKGLSERTVLCTVILPADGKLTDLLKENGCAVYVLPERVRSKTSWWWCGINSDDYSKRKMTDSFDVVVNQIVPELKKISPDVIFSQTIVSPWGAVCASLLNIPHVLSSREYGILDHNLQFFFGFEESINVLYKCSNEVFCVTNDVRNTLFGQDEDKKTTVVYSHIQVNSEIENAENKKYDTVYNANWESPVAIGIFGNICKGKGQEDIIRASIELRQKGFNVKCIMAGYVSDDEYLKNLEQIIDQSGFSDLLVRYDFTDNPYPLMKQTDIIVSCARMEALGRTLLEAILLEKPIIYANSGGTKEVFIDEIHGLAYKAGDYEGLANKILLTINNRENTQKRIETALEYVHQKFNGENYAGKIYNKLVSLKQKNHRESSYAVIELINALVMKDTSGILLTPKLFYSKNVDEFNEQQNVLSQETPFGIFSVSFLLPEGGWRYLRFDPTEEYGIELKIYEIVITTTSSEIKTNPDTKIYSNGIQKNKQSWVFFHFDPQVYLDFEVGVKGIEILGELIRIDTAQMIEANNKEFNKVRVSLNQKNEELNQKDEELNQKLRQASDIIRENKRTIQNNEQKIISLYNSFSWKITKPLRFLFSGFMAIFYFVFPYGSKRWAIIKAFSRVITRPVFYFKKIDRKFIKNYFRVLNTVNLIEYNKRIEKQNKVYDNDKANPVSFTIATDDEGEIVSLLDRGRVKGKQYMLMIDELVPTFDKDAGSKTIQSYMELFKEHDIEVIFVGDHFHQDEKYLKYFTQKGFEIIYGEYWERNKAQWLNKYGKLLDYVFLSRPEIAKKYIADIKKHTDAKIFYYGHDLHFLREFRQYQVEKKEGLLKISQETKKLEGSIFELVDVVYYPSQAEIDIIQEEFKIKGKARKIIPYLFDDFPKPEYQFNKRKDILFVGGFNHTPNCDAMKWFLDDIFPTIRKSLPDLKLYIAGSHPTEELKSRSANNVVVTGYLSDNELRHLYNTCRIVIAPLRFGAGIKGKIVQAMYYGLPVITTSIGFEGLTGAESQLTIADTSDDFANSVVRLYSNEHELSYKSLASFEYVKQNFSKEKAISIIQEDLILLKNEYT